MADSCCQDGGDGCCRDETARIVTGLVYRVTGERLIGILRSRSLHHKRRIVELQKELDSLGSFTMPPTHYAGGGTTSSLYIQDPRDQIRQRMDTHLSESKRLEVEASFIDQSAFYDLKRDDLTALGAFQSTDE